MPLTRYRVRNEYSLADPELYRAADKDDPEALLEGVAMAGLVGLLRQLGDLAEFAAEIFHNLHEDVMATAARGHGLSLRVQQLEADFPLIEKAFLLQTSHSKFLHNTGVDWHPNLRLEQGLVTQGDLPRFVMDSYEECRGPPRLFLLDKFDVAGAGACLKRYTDPSFFKAEFTTSEAAKEELKREKKFRKAKKKGSRWKTGDSPEEMASHTKLHQLLLEDRYQSRSNVDTHHVKLKRRHSNNSLINSTTGKSYMERILKSRSPDNKFVSRGSSISSRLDTGFNKISGLDLEREIPENNIVNELLTRDRRPVQSHRREEKLNKPLLDESSRDVTEDRNSIKLHELPPETELKSIPPTFYRVEDKNELVVDVKGDTEAIATGYHSDEANSEIENFTDALTTMDSEFETDTESKTKKGRRLKIGRKRAGSDAYERRKVLPTQFSDSRSILSEDGNDSFEKGRFSSSFSDTFSNSAENILSDGDHEATTLPVTVSKNVDISSEMTHVVRSAHITRSPDHAAFNGSCNDVSEIHNHSSFRVASCDSDMGDSVSVVSTSSPRERSGEVQLLHPNSVVTTSKDVDSKSESDSSAGNSLSRRTIVSDFSSQSRNDFPSLGSNKSRTVEIFNSGNRDDVSEISMHLSDILDPVHEVKDVSDIEETRAAVVADDYHCANQMNGKLHSPDSVLLNSETQLYDGLAVEARPDTRWASECKPGTLTTCDVRSDGTVTDLKEVAASGETMDCLTSVVMCSENDGFREKNNQKIITEADTGESEVERQIRIVESNMSNYEMNDEQEPDRIHVNSLFMEGQNDISHELPFTCTASSATDTSLLVADSETTYMNLEGMEHATVSPIVSSNGDVNQEKLEVTGAAAANIDERSNTKNEVDDQSVDVFSNVRQSDGRRQLQHALKNADEKKTLSTPTNLLEIGSFRESLESHPREDNLWTYQQNGETTSSPTHEYDGVSSAPSKSSLIDSPSQAADSSFLPSTTHGEFARSNPSVLLLQSTSQQSDLHEDLNNQHLLDSEPHIVPVISHSDNNDVQDGVEEVPPLPPLPPMQWRMGKLRLDHPTFMNEMTPTMLDAPAPLLVETADWVAQQHIPNIHEDLAHPRNPFLQNAPSDSKNLQYGLQLQGLGNEVISPSLSPLSPVVGSAECQNIQMDHPVLGPTVMNPLYQPIPLLHGDLQQGSSDSGKDKLHHTGLNPFTPASDADDFNLRPISPTSQQGRAQAFDISIPTDHREEVQPPHNFLNLGGVTMQPQISTMPATTENMKHGNDTQAVEAELKWQSNSLAFIPAVEYGKPMESLKSRLSRPRDPLIQAVASHDKSNLRKVTERVIPETGPQVDERNSLLEQIRAKSFNLKPAVATRPSVQGPKTNLKVVAILEKANAIRQALAGSDDDDDDNDSWSDS